MIVYVVIAIVILLILFVISQYNGLVKARNRVKTKWAQIDVQLKKRADLIPNLVETVKGYAKHESSTMEAVIKARNSYVSADSIDGKMEASNQITGALSHLFALSESYPDLKANTNFMALQDELINLEDKIAYSRQFYNDTVYSYMNKLEMFPSSIIASIFNFEPYGYFEVDEEDKKNVQVKF